MAERASAEARLLADLLPALGRQADDCRVARISELPDAETDAVIAETAARHGYSLETAKAILDRSNVTPL